jgi:hypothetical protein
MFTYTLHFFHAASGTAAGHQQEWAGAGGDYSAGKGLWALTKYMYTSK